MNNIRIIGLVLAIVAAKLSVKEPSVVLAKNDDNPALHLVTDDTQQIRLHAAFALLEEYPETLLVDVRDPVEINTTGSPIHIDAVVPYMVRGTEFNETTKQWMLEHNPNFLALMDQAIEKHGKTINDLIIVTCGCHIRSEHAAKALKDHGYTNVLYIADGQHLHTENGPCTDYAWRMAGLPWNFDTIHIAAHPALPKF